MTESCQLVRRRLLSYRSRRLVDVRLIHVVALIAIVELHTAAAAAVTGRLHSFGATDQRQFQQLENHIRRPHLIRTGTQLPSDPWQLFNITVKHSGNKTEGMLAVVYGKGLGGWGGRLDHWVGRWLADKRSIVLFFI